jgi:hypothetical protein
LLGINTSILSIPEALAALMRANAALNAPSSTASLENSMLASNPAANSNTVTATGGAYQVSDYSIEAMIYGTRGRGEEGNKQLYDWAYKFKNSGVTLARLNQIANVPAGTAEEWAKSNGLPTFAKGGDHKGGWAMVGERGPELAYMPASRIYSAPDTNRMLSSANSDAAIERLTEKVQELTKELEKVTANTGKTSEAVNGRPDRPMLVEVTA